MNKIILVMITWLAGVNSASAFELINLPGVLNTDLVAANNLKIGGAVITNDDSVLKISLNTNFDWKIRKVHLYVSKHPLPLILLPGLFPYHSGDFSRDPVPFFEKTIALAELGVTCSGKVYVSAYLEVQQLNALGVVLVDLMAASAFADQLLGLNLWGWSGLYKLKCEDVPMCK